MNVNHHPPPEPIYAQSAGGGGRDFFVTATLDKSEAKMLLGAMQDDVPFSGTAAAPVAPMPMTLSDSLARRLARLKGGNPKITFVRGPIVSATGSINNEATPAIAFAYLRAYLIERGYRTSQVDAIGEGLNQVWPLPDYPGFQCQGLTFEEIVNRVDADTDVIGFSAMFSGEWPIQRDLIRRLRQHFPDTVIVAGGEHISGLTEYVLRDCPELDACIRGEGEFALAAFMDAVAAGSPLDEVPSVAVIDASGTYRLGSAVTRVRDIGSLPWPHWEPGYLERFWAAGKSYGVQTARDMPMMLSRGCPYQCTFCSNPQMWTTRYVLRNVDDIVHEIQHYRERYDITAVQLYDLTAITKKRWAIELFTKVIDSGIAVKWSLPSGTRSEALDGETLSLMKRAGVDYIVYAPESGSPSTLERIKKRIDLDKLTESLLIARQVGMTTRANLIIGFPHETRSDVLKTVWFGLKLAAKGIDEVPINIYSAYPGTEIFEELVKDGQITLSDRHFLGLTSLNSRYGTLGHRTANRNMGMRELSFYRIAAMLSNYAISYLFYPSRIVRTLRNFLSDQNASTVFEHRIKDAIKRRRHPSG